MAKTRQQYGTWSSPFSPKSIASGKSLYDVLWDTDGQTLIWQESQEGIGTLVAQSGNDAPKNVTEQNINIRGRVGYGGGGFTVASGMAYFVANNRLYCQPLNGGQAKAITPAFGNAASPRVSTDGKWVAYVHTYEDTDGIAIVDTEGKHWSQKLAYGTDFVMQPTWHPSGNYLAYIAWNHPQMPWNGTQLQLVQLSKNAQGLPYAEKTETLVGDTETAIFQPEFSPDGKYLSYVNDTHNFGQLYLYNLESKAHTQITDAQAEHGTPGWIQGLRMYDWANENALFYLQNKQGVYSLWRYDVSNKQSTEIPTDYTYLSYIATSSDEKVALIASSSTQTPRIITIDTKAPIQERIYQRSSTENIPAESFAKAEAISWTDANNQQIHGIYYAPNNPSIEGVGKPPLVVLVHGGPTSQRDTRYEASSQLFATRGYAVLMVNHRGSTGYGKDYMNQHAGTWGIVDVEDSVSGAKHLCEQGLADPTKVVIMGGSAGGYTVLQALVNHPGFFKAGVCAYGISNLFLLAQDTHKFESRYNDWLLGALPEAGDVWRERSPIYYADKIVDPIIIFQGTDDNVVPQNQSDAIVATLRERGIVHEYHIYEGEGHGWRKPETIEDYYTKILRFLELHVVYN